MIFPQKCLSFPTLFAQNPIEFFRKSCYNHQTYIFDVPQGILWVHLQKLITALLNSYFAIMILLLGKNSPSKRNCWMFRFMQFHELSINNAKTPCILIITILSNYLIYYIRSIHTIIDWIFLIYYFLCHSLLKLQVMNKFA